MYRRHRTRSRHDKPPPPNPPLRAQVIIDLEELYYESLILGNSHIRSIESLITSLKNALALRNNAEQFKPATFTMLVVMLQNFGVRWLQLSSVHQDILACMHKVKDKISAQQLVDVLFAFSSLGINWTDIDSSFKLALVQSIMVKINHVDAAKFSSLLLGLAAIGGLDFGNIFKFYPALAKFYSAKQFTDREYLRIYTAFTFCCGIDEEAWRSLDDTLKTKIYINKILCPISLADIISAAVKDIRSDYYCSSIQQNVLHALSQKFGLLGGVESELLVECMIVDICIPRLNLVIEINDQNRTILPLDLNINQVIKLRLLKLLGYTVKQLEVADWSKQLDMLFPPPMSPVSTASSTLSPRSPFSPFMPLSADLTKSDLSPKAVPFVPGYASRKHLQFTTAPPPPPPQRTPRLNIYRPTVFLHPKS